jgi:hypothetical protein
MVNTDLTVAFAPEAFNVVDVMLVSILKIIG